MDENLTRWDYWRGR